jgi:phosphoribosyl 1,2-cyclic phosphodiesterase
VLSVMNMRHVHSIKPGRPVVIDGQQAAPSVRFWGVRGSLPVPGAGTVAFGGNTACMEVRLGLRRVIIDAGTGIAALGIAMKEEGGDEPVHILLSHLHHDHVSALVFFKPIFQRGRQINVWCGNLGGESAEQALRRMFSPPLFPVTFADMPAQFRFHGFRAGETIDVDGLAVRTAPLNHPSGATGYRFDQGGGSLAVITDIEHAQDDIEPDPPVLDLCRGVDTIVYDMMMEETDFPTCRGWGHSTARAGVRLAERAGARQLIGFHHSPMADDAVMEDRERRLRAAFSGAAMAREGMTVSSRPSAVMPDASLSGAAL